MEPTRLRKTSIMPRNPTHMAARTGETSDNRETSCQKKTQQHWNRSSLPRGRSKASDQLVSHSGREPRSTELAPEDPFFSTLMRKQLKEGGIVPLQRVLGAFSSTGLRSRVSPQDPEDKPQQGRRIQEKRTLMWLRVFWMLTL